MNMKTAMRWFEKASEQGEVTSMSMLCFMHYKGLVDQTKDYLSAAKWCRKAGDAGDAKAQYNLGVMVAHGQGLEQDFVASYQWLTLAMHRLPEESLAARNSLVTKMTHEEVEQGQIAAEEWRTTHRMMKRGTYAELQKFWKKVSGSEEEEANRGGGQGR